MKILKKTISAAAMAAIATEYAQANSESQQRVLETVRPGVYYHLTPLAAQALKIDVAVLVETIQLQKSQRLAFQLQEDGELNLECGRPIGWFSRLSLSRSGGISDKINWRFIYAKESEANLFR